jgi:hypothetical protein
MFPLNLFVSCAYTWIFRAEYDYFSCPLYARIDPQPPLGFVKFPRISSTPLESTSPRTRPVDIIAV